MTYKDFQLLLYVDTGHYPISKKLVFGVNLSF